MGVSHRGHVCDDNGATRHDACHLLSTEFLEICFSCFTIRVLELVLTQITHKWTYSGDLFF